MNNANMEQSNQMEKEEKQIRKLAKKGIFCNYEPESQEKFLYMGLSSINSIFYSNLHFICLFSQNEIINCFTSKLERNF